MCRSVIKCDQLLVNKQSRSKPSTRFISPAVGGRAAASGVAVGVIPTAAASPAQLFPASHPPRFACRGGDAFSVTPDLLLFSCSLSSFPRSRGDHFAFEKIESLSMGFRSLI